MELNLTVIESYYLELQCITVKQMVKKFALIAICVIAFIILTTFNFEYLVNRQSSTALAILALVNEILLIYFLIYKPVKYALK